MEKFFEINCIRGYHVYKKAWAATVGEALVCERTQKPFRSIRCGCEKRRNYHRAFTSKAVGSVFATVYFPVAKILFLNTW